MPFRRYKKRYNRKRKYGGSKWARYGASAGRLAYRAYQGVKYIKSMINTEKHFTDTATSINADTTGSVILLSGCAQGDDVYQRQGNSVLAKAVYGRITLQRASANTATINSVRVMLLKDLENTGTAPTIADILASSDVRGPLNVDHTSRYQILMDKVYTLSLNGSEGYNLKVFKKINDHIKYTGPNATDVYKNSIYMVVIGDIPSASNPPTFASWFRMSFYDN